MCSGLNLESVNFSYDSEDIILEGINLKIPSGQFLTLLGSSGSGKSTLLRLIAGLESPTTGRISWENQQILGPGIERGIVFQDYSLFPWFSVVDNIALAVEKANKSLSKRERRQEAEQFLLKVGLQDAIGKYPFELSGGMRQRAAIARALALGSPLLLMDEPFGALDAVNRARLQDLVLDIHQKAVSKKTIVFVTHDIDEALYLGDRTIILGSSPGKIIADIEAPIIHGKGRAEIFESKEFQALRDVISEKLRAEILTQLANV